MPVPRVQSVTVKMIWPPTKITALQGQDIFELPEGLVVRDLTGNLSSAAFRPPRFAAAESMRQILKGVANVAGWAEGADVDGGAKGHLVVATSGFIGLRVCCTPLRCLSKP
ncbi:hypothetical protein NJB1507_37830 [Mycobacterium marinum]|uniref:Uncharacterized protein n=1 Tax=Mycobacterium marinum TaxID=1781 RepID=A0A3E2MUV0_MYCMR|nr:hypothetical protein DAVIS_03031 [Mycobacterium marinum]GJO30116.1 hypothetical protein NJB1507_37830 [Mycobacterium marinum]GJO55990.1 hypothetical protein NJB1604_47430 [Mycobacterium marinum]